ncbi:hypothetical protein [Virgibacillus pantothenticus]|uniref:hypothetical protein n=1 Tax=Virgibacillus pantothenticus TaxID=1473 RepID=UPI0009878C7F|nr:hypothetical protein [Virgibacillus pantothenticus]
MLHDIDIVFDTLGAEFQHKSYAILKEGGKLVSIVDPSHPNLTKTTNVDAGFVFLKPDGEKLREIA